MRALFERYGVSVIALSKDAPANAALQRSRDGLSFVRLLSDAKLEVIARYGLEHHKGLEFKSWSVLGIPLGVPSGYKRMAIPTSLLVDEQGCIRWIDQADDYRMRGDEARIHDAFTKAFGATRSTG